MTSGTFIFESPTIVTGTSSGLAGLMPIPAFAPIIVSEPTHDPILVRSQLTYFYATYPDQLFLLNASDLDNSKMIISWIPGWLAPMWAAGLLYQAFANSFSWAPWPEVLKK